MDKTTHDKARRRGVFRAWGQQSLGRPGRGGEVRWLSTPQHFFRPAQEEGYRRQARRRHHQAIKGPSLSSTGSGLHGPRRRKLGASTTPWSPSSPCPTSLTPCTFTDRVSLHNLGWSRPSQSRPGRLKLAAPVPVPLDSSPTQEAKPILLRSSGALPAPASQEEATGPEHWQPRTAQPETEEP